MRLQLSQPGEHAALFSLAWSTPLGEWPEDRFVDPGGLHRHVVRFYEVGDVTYVLKELPAILAEREYRLLRALADEGIPTATAIGVVTERGPGVNSEGILITRHIDFSLPYRVLLSGRGLRIPYLGERVLDALVGLLVRLHLAGFFWGDCSLSNTLFRRDAGSLVAFVIDLETGELHPELTNGQRAMDLTIAVENIAGGLYDLQQAGRLAEGIDPFETAYEVERRYEQLWRELTEEQLFQADEIFRIEQRIRQLNEMGFDVAELDYQAGVDGDRISIVPRVVENGFHAPRLAALTGLRTGENQARRLLNDISQYRAWLERTTGRRLPETMVAARWLDQVYEPTVISIPEELSTKLEPAEFFHQVLEHRWFLSEAAKSDVGLEVAVQSYLENVLRYAPDELRVMDPPTSELPIVVARTPAT